MIPTPPAKPPAKTTHYSVQLHYFFTEILKYVGILILLNCSVFILSYFILPSLIGVYIFEMFFLYEGGILVFIGALAFTIRDVKNKIIEEKGINKIPNPENTDKKSLGFLNKTVIIRTQNLKGIVWFFSGLIIVLISILIDVLFVSNNFLGLF